jgi:hypothetical protein
VKIGIVCAVCAVEAGDGGMSGTGGAGGAGLSTGGEFVSVSSFSQLLDVDPASLASLLENEDDLWITFRSAMALVLVYVMDALGGQDVKAVP